MAGDLEGKVGIVVTGTVDSGMAAIKEAIANVQAATVELRAAVIAGAGDADAALAKQVAALTELRQTIVDVQAAGLPVPPAALDALEKGTSASQKYSAELVYLAQVAADAAAASEKQIAITGDVTAGTVQWTEANIKLIASFLDITEAQAAALPNWEKQLNFALALRAATTDLAEAEKTFAAATADESERIASSATAYNVKQEALVRLNSLYESARAQVLDFQEAMAEEKISVDDASVAFGRVVIELAAFREGIAQAQAAGLPVPQAAITQLEAMEADIASLRLQLAGLAESEAAAGVAGADMGEKIGAGDTAANLERAAVSFRGLKVGALDAVAGFTALGAEVLSVVLIIGLLPLVVEQIGRGFTAVIGFLGDMTQKFADWTQGVEDTTVKIKGQKVAVDDLTEAGKNLGDQQQKNALIQHAIAMGLIEVSDSAKVAAADIDVLTNDVEHAGPAMDALDADFKKIGITVPQTFDQLGGRVNAFMLLYDKLFKVDGPAAAEQFAGANKKFLQEVVDAAEVSGVEVPPKIQAIADKYHIVGSAAAESEKEIQANSDALLKAAQAQESLDKSTAGLIDQLDKEREHAATTTAQIIASTAAENAAIHDKSTKAVNDIQTEINAIIAKGDRTQADTNRLNDLMHQQTVIQTQALADTVKNNDASITSQKQVADDTAKAQGKIQLAIKETTGQGEDAARIIHDGLDQTYKDLGYDGADAAVQIGVAAGTMVASAERVDSQARSKIHDYGQEHINAGKAVEAHGKAHPPFVDLAVKAGKDIEKDALPPILHLKTIHSDAREQVQGLGKDFPVMSGAASSAGGPIDDLAGKVRNLKTACSDCRAVIRDIFAMGSGDSAAGGDPGSIDVPEAASTTPQGPPAPPAIEGASSPPGPPPGASF